MRGLCAPVGMAVATGLDSRLVQQLTDAMQQLEHGGLLNMRELMANVDDMVPAIQRSIEAVQDSSSAPGLRTCALPGCGAKEAHPAHFKRCAACRAVVYCSKEHQVQDWPAHKAVCKAARKAKAAEEAGPTGA